MKKILSLLCLLMLAMTSAWAGEVATFDLGTKNGVSAPEGFFKSVGEKWNWNTKFTGGEYDGKSFSQGLKMEGSTKIGFTTTEVSTVTIVQSTWSANTITFDGAELAVADAADGTQCRIYTLTDVAAGDHVIGRGNGESGLFYVKVEWEATKTVTFINDANWETVYVYAWSGEGENTQLYTSEWPGDPLTPNADGTYTWTTTGDPTGIVFSNGTAQTPDLEFKDGGKYDSTKRIIEMNNFSVSFKTDGMDEVYAYVWSGEGENKVLGDWPGKKMEGGNGEFSITFEAEDAPKYIIFHNNAGEQTQNLPFEDGKAYEYMLSEFTATFTTDAEWATVNAYAWTDNGTDVKKFLGEWPGTAITATDGVYSLSFKAFVAPEMIIFNGGDAGQTPDLPFNTGRAYKWNTTLDPLFKLQESSEAIPAGTTVEVKDGEDVVATLTYGVSGGADFAAPMLRASDEYAAFQYYTGGNGENGTATSGTVYTIVPKYDGTITVGVWLNANKSFFIEEDGTALADYNGIKATYASGTAFEFPVKANSEYKVYCTGSKLGFYGFDYKYEKPALNTYTAKFENNGNWAEVYAYAWTTTGEGDEAVTKEFLGEWPGTKIEPSNDGYVVTIEAEEAPAMIIFNNGDQGLQTADLDFEDGKTYTYEAPAQTATFDFSDPNFRENVGEAMTDTKGYIYNETFTVDGTTLQITAGSAPSRIYIDGNRGQCLVTYTQYTTLTFRAPQGKAITKIEFTAAGNSNINKFTASSGAIEGMTWTGDADGVRFAQGGTSYLANAIVTLQDVTPNTAALPAIEYVECANIAAFNALEAGTYTKLTLTDAEVIGKSDDGYSTVWVQDATGGAWIQYTTLNDQLQEKTKLNGTVYTIKRNAPGKDAHLKEAEDTPQSNIESAGIEDYTVYSCATIAEANEKLNMLVKIEGATFTATSTSAGTLTLGEETIKVNNGAANANQQLHKLDDFVKGDVLENVTVIGINTVAYGILPISIEKYFDPNETFYTVAGGYEGVEGGTDDVILGKAWEPALDENDMTLGEDGIYSLVKEGLMLKAGNYEYKVVKNHSWENESYPAEFNATLVIENDGFYNVTFTFNPENQYVDASLEAISVTETLNVERYTGLGYTTTSATVDFAAAIEYLGVEELTDNMLVIINPDGTEVGSTSTDGWFNGEGYAETWGTNTKINVKFFQAIPEGTYTICDMNGADVIGDTYTVTWALTANSKYYIYNINVTFVETPEVGELTKSDLSVATSVEYTTDEGSYVTKWASLTDDQVAAICTELGFESLSEATVYGYNPTTGELLNNYAGFDGWRDANGDFHYWTDTAETPFCVKYNDGQNYECYNKAGLEPQTFKGYWALANDKKYVLVEIEFIYAEPAPIELTLTDVEVEVNVTYNVTWGDYTEQTYAFSDEEATSILGAIGLESFDDESFQAFIYDPATQTFSNDSFDGWRSADGLGHTWTGTEEAPACAQFRNNGENTPKMFYFYNLYGIEPQTITTYYAFANATTGKAALIKVNFVYEGTFPTYTVAGAFGDGVAADADDVIFQKAWDPTLAANNMTKDGRTTWTLTIEDVELTAGTIYYKVVQDNSWDKNWGFNGENADYVVNMPEGFDKALCTITFTFSPVGPVRDNFNVACDVVVGEGITDGINAVNAKNLDNQVIYNLQGVRLEKLQKGLNIVGGKKVVIK